MKRLATKGLCLVAMLATLSAAVPASAFADSTTTTTTLNVKGHHQALRTYAESVRSIREAFRSAVDSARAAFWTAMSGAKTAADRSAARATYLLAITNATNDRSAALTQLGNPPAKSPHRPD